jgi:hypothetical protein
MAMLLTLLVLQGLRVLPPMILRRLTMLVRSQPVLARAHADADGMVQMRHLLMLHKDMVVLMHHLPMLQTLLFSFPRIQIRPEPSAVVYPLRMGLLPQ